MSRPVIQIADQAERERALDVRHSFIVRAPAGAGKTRLLIQRYLALLAGVEEPEEITAITFTRKAAAEMRARVLRAFAAVSKTETTSENTAGAPDNDDALTRDLAQRALARDTERGWQLAENPSRLRIQTIDAMNASLTRQMPLSARFGAQPESIDDAGALYRDAARNLLAMVNEVDENGAVADDIATLLGHLDNNFAVAENLLAEMLRSRDQWLRNLPHMHERDALEGALARVRAHAAARVAGLFPEAEKVETLALAGFSGQNRPESLASGGVWQNKLFDDATAFPTADAATMPQWLAIADLLLTQNGEWRKRGGLNKNAGFPTSADTAEKARLNGWKTRMGDLLDRFALAGGESDSLRIAMGNLREMPPATYSDDQWAVLGAIVRLLPYATAQLWNEFGAKGKCDFTEISQAASRALGDDDAPTDLALALDYRIHHLLIDEFQDTSIAQFELLEKLTRGWTDGDGRTLLAVGDPMQSIYRFREAEVGLFLNAASTGIGTVSLTPLTLQVNFRSQRGIVDWVNQTFSRIMPSIDDAMANDVSGVVPYAPSVAHAAGEKGNTPAVKWHPQFVRKRGEDTDNTAISSHGEEEAWRVVDIIRARWQSEHNAEIAILVRNRGHLQHIVPALKAAGIAFRAVDIDPLKTRPVVLDLLSLTRALLHLADRIAWLAVLRAPWCGLTLNDLAALTGATSLVNGELVPDPRSIWQILCDDTRVALLSVDGQTRAKRLRAVLVKSLSLCRRMPLRELVESTWHALQGPACLAEVDDLDCAAQLLDMLEEEAQAQTGGGDIADLAAMENRVDKLYAGSAAMQTDAITTTVQIMTIHKAKGLEFDTVIVPGLHRTPRQDSRKLLAWTEQLSTQASDRSELLLAPIGETGAVDENDAIYRYVRQRNRDKQQQEDVRLLYVAATRAEQQLHFLASVIVSDGEGEDVGEVQIVAPRATSLLASMWTAVAEVFIEVVVHSSSLAAVPMSALARSVAGRPPIRLAANSPMPSLSNAIAGDWRASGTKAAGLLSAIDFEWAGDVARHVGTVVHGFLQVIAEDGLQHWNEARVAASRNLFERELVRLAVVEKELPVAVDRVVKALTNTLADKRGRWALHSHPQARSEWRLTGMVENTITHVAIDRTFVDENGVRWIVDFKTGGHEGANAEAFLDNEQIRYRKQLEIYAALMHAIQPGIETPPIKLGLYFPLLSGWREWDWPAEQ